MKSFVVTGIFIGLSLTVATAAPGDRGCKLPDKPSHGSYAVRGCSDTDKSPACAAVPTTVVSSGTILNYNCDAGYTMEGVRVGLCSDGELSPKPPICRAEVSVPRGGCLLPNRPSHGTYAVRGCKDTASACAAEPASPVSSGTVLNYDCDPGYRMEGVRVGYCADGGWSPKPPECVAGDHSAAVAGCRLPATPSNGRYLLRGCREEDASPACTVVPATLVGSGTILQFECNPGFTVDGVRVTFCVDGQWSPKPPTCTVLCKPLTSNTLDIACYKQATVNPASEIPCASPMAVGTLATIVCKNGYRPRAGFHHKVKCLSGGRWDKLPMECSLDCGRPSTKTSVLISYGTDAQVPDYPWHVAIYRYKNRRSELEQICAGTLISSRLMLSAAHCFWDKSTATTFPKENYKFVLGKYFRTWDAKEDLPTFVREADDILVWNKYRHRKGNYQNDIAIVVLNDLVAFTSYVKPICIDWDNSKETQQLRPGTAGVVVGWGITENNTWSETLKTTTMEFVDPETCRRHNPESFEAYSYQKDKFCAGYTNGTSVCKGDSGGGLAFRDNMEGPTRGKWFLRGIVSVGPEPEDGATCARNYYAAFTLVSEFREWIKSYYSQYTI